MKDVAGDIRGVVAEVAAVLSHMQPGEVSAKAQPDAWSKQEILGHMINSAANNHQRFVRAACNPTVVTSHVYSQADWVRVQQYNELEWDALVALWSAYNNHLSRVIEHLPAGVLSAPCDIGKEAPVSLEFVIRDYLRHLRHHVGELLGS